MECFAQSCTEFSPSDLAPSDCHLFTKLNDHLSWTHFSNDEK